MSKMTLSAIRRYGLTPAIGLSALLASTVMAVTSGPTATGVLGRAPTAENLEFEPAAVYGVESKDVKLKYRFNDPDGDDELGSVFSWATTDGAGNAIALGQTSSIPVVPEAAINQPLTACVTPKTSDIITDPSQGNQECATTTVLPPPPLVKNVDVKVKEADGLFVDTNNLTATYTWEGVGNDTSIYAYGPQGQSATLLQNGSGANTSTGTVPDFSLAGYAGRRVELSIQPQSHYGGIGSIVTTPVNAYIYNPNLPPIISSYNLPSGSTTARIPEFSYVFDRAGGADGDNSTYDFYVGDTLVNSGNTANGVVPSQTIPSGVFGSALVKINPINGLGVRGNTFTTTTFIRVPDPNEKPIVSDVEITYSNLSVGELLKGGYTIANGGSYNSRSFYAWREYTQDSDSDKRNYINRLGRQIDFDGTRENVNGVPLYRIPESMIGKKVELLILGVSYNGVYADSVASSSTPIIPGTAPVVNPYAKPAISHASIGVEHYPYLSNRTKSAYYTFTPNGGDLIDKSIVYIRGVNILDGTIKSRGSIALGSGILRIPCYYNEVLEMTFEPINGLGVKGDKVIVTTSELGIGPEGLGYCYDSYQVGRMPVPKLDFKSSEQQLFVGSQLDATYTGFALSPGMQDITSASWNGGKYIEVTTPGVLPSYTIKQSDTGKPIYLSVRYSESDKKGISANAKVVTYTTDGFLSGIAIER